MRLFRNTLILIATVSLTSAVHSYMLKRAECETLNASVCAASYDGDNERLKTLLRSGANPNGTTTWGRLWSETKPRPNEFRCGNGKNGQCLEPLDLAIIGGAQVDTVKLLVSHGARIQGPDSFEYDLARASTQAEVERLIQIRDFLNAEWKKR